MATETGSGVAYSRHKVQQRTYFDMLPPELIEGILDYLQLTPESTQFGDTAFDAHHYVDFKDDEAARRKGLSSFRQAWPRTYLESIAEVICYKRISFHGMCGEFLRILDEVRDRPERRYWCRCLDLRTAFNLFEEELGFGDPKQVDCLKLCSPLSDSSEIDCVQSLFMTLGIIGNSEIEEGLEGFWELTRTTSMSRVWVLLHLFPNIQSLELCRVGGVCLQILTILDMSRGWHPLVQKDPTRPLNTSLRFDDMRRRELFSHRHFNSHFLESVKPYLPVNLLTIPKGLQYIVVDPCSLSDYSAHLVPAIYQVPMFFLPNIRGITALGMQSTSISNPMVSTGPAYSDRQSGFNYCPLSFIYRINFESLIGSSALTSLEIHQSKIHDDIYGLLSLPKALRIFRYTTPYNTLINARTMENISRGLRFHTSSLERLTLRGIQGEIDHGRRLCSGDLHDFTSLKYLSVNWSLLFPAHDKPAEQVNLNLAPCTLPPLLETLVLEVALATTHRDIHQLSPSVLEGEISQILTILATEHESIPTSLQILEIHVEVTIVYQYASMGQGRLSGIDFKSLVRAFQVQLEKELDNRVRNINTNVKVPLKVFILEPL